MIQNMGRQMTERQLLHNPFVQVSGGMISQSLVQVDSEPDTMFSDYQNYGTYGPNLPDQNYGMFGPNLPGFKKRNRVAFTFGLGK